jgi:hypothetical protein
MSTHEAVQTFLKQLPPDVSPLRGIAREIEFIASVREGLTELDRDEAISSVDVRRELRE